MGYGDNSVFEVRTINKIWDDQNASWDNLATAFDSEIVATYDYKKGTKGWIPFDVTEVLSDVVNNGSEHHGFMIFAENDASNGMSGHISLIHSSESQIQENRPKLVVTFKQSTPVSPHDLQKKSPGMRILYYSYNKLFLNISKSGLYAIQVYTSNGRLNHVLKDKYFTCGVHAVNCNQFKLAHGLYIINLRHENKQVSTRIIIP